MAARPFQGRRERAEQQRQQQQQQRQQEEAREQARIEAERQAQEAMNRELDRKHGGVSTREYNRLVKTYGRGGPWTPVSRLNRARRERIEAQINAYRQARGMERLYLHPQGLSTFRKPTTTWFDGQGNVVRVNRFTGNIQSIIGTPQELPSEATQRVDVSGMMSPATQETTRAVQESQERRQQQQELLRQIDQQTQAVTVQWQGQVRPTPQSGILDRARRTIEDRSRDFQAEARETGLSTTTSQILSVPQKIGLGVTESISGNWELARSLTQGETYSMLYRGARQFVSSPIQTTTSLQLGDKIVDAASNPARTAGMLATDIATGSVAKRIVDNLVRTGKNIATATTRDRVPIETVARRETIEQGTFPTTKSVEESVAVFKGTAQADGSIRAVTASPARIAGTEAGAGRKGGARVPLEDPGIYVTPEGAVSLPFLRLSQAPTSWSLNPVDAVRGWFSRPTVTRFDAADVQRLPALVRDQPGFQAVRDFFEQRTPTGEVFITKRSEIGQGSVQRQQFVATQDFESPIARTVIRDGAPVPGQTQIRRGDILQEAGTSELEAVVPFRQPFVVTGSDTFFTYQGVNVPIVDARLTRGTTSQPSSPVSPLTPTESARQVASGAEDFYSLVRGDRVSTPYPGLVGTASAQPTVSSTSGLLQAPSTSLGASPVQSTPSSQVSTVRIIPPSIVSSVSDRSTISPSKLISAISSEPRSPVGASTITPQYNPPPSTISSSTSAPTSVSTIRSPPSPVVPGTSTPLVPPRTPGKTSTPTSRPGTGQKRRRVQAFQVMVRRQGEFKQVSTKPLSKSDALGLGTYKVGTTAAATFKLKEVDVFEDELGKFMKRGNIGDFDIRPDKKTGTKLFIERPEKRISTPGELQQITFKGLATQKGRRSLDAKQSRKKWKL